MGNDVPFRYKTKCGTNLYVCQIMSTKEFWKLGESKKKTNDNKRQTSKADTQEATFKSSKLTELFEHSLKSERGYCVPSTLHVEALEFFFGSHDVFKCTSLSLLDTGEQTIPLPLERKCEQGAVCFYFPFILVQNK